MSKEIKEKPNLKELRKNQQFMKTIYDQQYIGSKWSLNRVAQYLEEMTGTSITGKTIGSDLKKFGFKLRPARKKAVSLPLGDISKLESSKEELIQLQKMYIFYKIKGWKHFGDQSFYNVVSPEEFKVVEQLAFGGAGIEQIREHEKERAKWKREMVKKDKRIAELESEKSSFLMGIQKYASSQSKNPLSELL